MTIVFTPAIEASIQFGNSFDTNGAKIVTGKILAEQDRLVKVFLVQDGNTFGLATKAHAGEDDVKAEYYCTKAFPISKSFPVEFVARQLGFPVELFDQAA